VNLGKSTDDYNYLDIIAKATQGEERRERAGDGKEEYQRLERRGEKTRKFETLRSFLVDEKERERERVRKQKGKKREKKRKEGREKSGRQKGGL
jgi:hypothetical protein